jgi:hypothetical protein
LKDNEVGVSGTIEEKNGVTHVEVSDPSPDLISFTVKINDTLFEI